MNTEQLAYKYCKYRDFSILKTIGKQNCFYCLIYQLKRLPRLPSAWRCPSDTGQKTNYQPTQMAEENRHSSLSGERRLVNLQMKFIERDYSALIFCCDYSSEAQCTSKDNTHKSLVIKKKQKDPQSLYASRYSSALHWNDLCSTLLFVLLSCSEALIIIVTTFASTIQKEIKPALK